VYSVRVYSDVGREEHEGGRAVLHRDCKHPPLPSEKREISSEVMASDRELRASREGSQ